MDTVQLDLFGNPILPQPPAKKAKVTPPANLPSTHESVTATQPVAETADIPSDTTALEVVEANPLVIHHELLSNSNEEATPTVADLPGNHPTTSTNTEPESTIVYSNNTIAVKIKNTHTTTFTPDTTLAESNPAEIEAPAEQDLITPATEVVDVAASQLADESPIAANQVTDIPLTIGSHPAIATDLPSFANHNSSKRGRKSFKEMDAVADLIDIPTDEVLQQKLYYTISEVAGWFKVNNSQIRFWENEFDILKPRKTRKGDRLFRVEDIKNLKLIHHLLRNKKYSIEGAKEYLKANKTVADKEMVLLQSLNHFRDFLLELKTNLQAS